ncbi:MAG: alpha/beta hydrolase [Sedimenticola sp.]
MPRHTVSDNESIYYLHESGSTPGAPTFVFFNPLTGDTGNWEAVIAPQLRKMGFGTLSFDYIGQTQSPSPPQTRLSSKKIINDAVSLLQAVGPNNPVFVGLSIGGLYAAQVWLAGAAANKLVLINTLRIDGPRLKWIGDALVRAVEIGGLELFRDMFLPLLMNEDWIASNRDNFLGDAAGYTPLKKESGTYKLLAQAGPSADWELPYERLTLPTWVVTGLQDHVFLEPQAVDQLFQRLPQAKRLDLPDAGHLIPGEHPQRIVDILNDAATAQEAS